MIFSFGITSNILGVRFILIRNEYKNGVCCGLFKQQEKYLSRHILSRGCHGLGCLQNNKNLGSSLHKY